MLDEQGKKNLWNWIHTTYLQPEIEKRQSEDKLPKNFKIWECLIKLPKSTNPIVLFNNECEWNLKINVPDDVEIQKDQEMYIHEYTDIETAYPPQVNGERVAFLFLYWAGYSYQIIFDFSPNAPDFNPARPFTMGKSVADFYRNKFREIIVRLSKNQQEQLRRIGLWTVTSLLPYPLSKIIERIGEGKEDEARQVLVDFCTYEFIADKLVHTWHPISVFKVREKVFKEALFNHQHKMYHASITVLISHIEGVIADWLHQIIPSIDVKWLIKSRVSQFRDILTTIPQFEFAYKEALETTIEFLQEGETAAKPFQAFKNWLDKVDPNFPARHAITHGKYVSEIYTEENSIKLFLLLDTICQFMMFYEARVLGRDLGQNESLDGQ